MTGSKTVRDLMVDVFEYPHMPYWFTIRQAAGIMKKTVIDAKKCMYPQAILVFDEKYTLIGTLSLSDILRGMTLGLRAGGPAADAVGTPDDATLALLEANLSDDLKKASEKPVSDIMAPVTASLSPDDPAVKAAFLMETGNLRLLPVLEDKKKLVGVVRLMEVFQEMSKRVLEK